MPAAPPPELTVAAPRLLRHDEGAVGAGYRLRAEDAPEVHPGDILDGILAFADAPSEDCGPPFVRLVRTAGIPPLCAAHNQPVWHRWLTRDQRPCAPAPDGGALVSDLGDLHRSLRVFLGVEDLRRAAQDGSTFTDTHARTDLQELVRISEGRATWDAPPSPQPRQDRQLLAQSLTALFAATGVHAALSWKPTHAPSLALACRDQWGAVVVELADRLTRPTAHTAEELYCAACGARVHPLRRPRDGEQVYCQRVPCQRERKRRNTARHRARTSNDLPTPETPRSPRDDDLIPN